jgi:hypothetical protein
MTIFSVQISKSLNSFIFELINNLDYIKKKFYIVSISSYILMNLFLVGFTLALFEMAYQYDQNNLIRASTTLILSSSLTFIALALLITGYFFVFTSRKIRNTTSTKSKTEIPFPTLDLALSQLIMELAKDREFKRKEAEHKSQFQTHANSTQSQNYNKPPQSPTTNEPYFKEAEGPGWSE